VAGTFMVPNYVNQIPYVSNSDNTIPPFYVVTNPTLTTNSTSIFGTYCYIKVNYEGASTIASPYIKTDGSVSMDLDYTPADLNDVATKKYIDNKLLDYQIPLSFSINDIGKRVPYYPQAENNPTLIALDGTKYLKSDYPDFDYNQEGFASNDTKFWFANIELELKSFQNNIQPSSEWFKLPLYTNRVKGQTLAGNFEFNSKMIYNFLNSPQGARFLFVNDIFDDNAENNGGFTILAPAEYRIRANYNNYEAANVKPESLIYKFKKSQESISVEGFGGAVDAVPIYTYIEGNGLTNLVRAHIGSIGEVSYLKIQPDYMVAKIQQVGSLASAGDLKSDRSVTLTGTGTFNTKQIAGMDDLKDSNIIVTNNAKAITTLDTKLIDMDSKITALESTVTTFKVAQSRRLVKPNTDIITIAGQSRLFPIDTFIPTTAAGYESDTFSIVNSNGKKVIKEKMRDGVITRHLNIRLSLGHTTTMANKKVELAVFLFRGSQTGLDDNSAVATGSSMLFYDTDTRGQSTNLLSVVVNGVDDAFVTEGFFIVLKSLNPSGPNPDSEKLIFSKGDILINIVNSN
jgi:hypothetical protein